LIEKEIMASKERHFRTHLWQKVANDKAPLLREQESANV